ncbi:hypothetical protein [Polymorphospora rubra]|nr:hypothetical protein [Polymorphospora rubra]
MPDPHPEVGYLDNLAGRIYVEPRTGWEDANQKGRLLIQRKP